MRRPAPKTAGARRAHDFALFAMPPREPRPCNFDPRSASQRGLSYHSKPADLNASALRAHRPRPAVGIDCHVGEHALGDWNLLAADAATHPALDVDRERSMPDLE